ncbi:MAG: hypothetical protein ACRDPY_03500 [Streptosporangiaceae bacterium]
MAATPLRLEVGQHRQLAATIFNHVWDLLVKADRTVADDDEMLHGAHASRYHWGVAGESATSSMPTWPA